MHVWFRWIFYLNPGAYAFEALMANEFVGRQFVCKEPDYIPYGSGYPSAASPHRGCSVLGSNADGIIDGAAYIREQYSYSFHHIWRSFGIIVGFWLFFIFLTSMGFELLNSQSGSSVLLYKRGSEKKQAKGTARDAMTEQTAGPATLSASAKQSIFTWHDLDYHVPFNGEKKQLLNKVFGYVKPGNLVALMGASGAGKTT
jgi:ABC-type multidrug transport system fused ATPase/permease subunit